MRPVPTEVAAIIRGQYDKSTSTWKVNTTIETMNELRMISHISFDSLFAQTESRLDLYELVKISIDTIIAPYGLTLAPIASIENLNEESQ